jgi:hypothetical protein
MDDNASKVEKDQPVNDWQMSTESFDANGCLINGD